jgi:hypothetical protein
VRPGRMAAGMTLTGKATIAYLHAPSGLGDQRDYPEPSGVTRLGPSQRTAVYRRCRTSSGSPLSLVFPLLTRRFILRWLDCSSTTVTMRPAGLAIFGSPLGMSLVAQRAGGFQRPVPEGMWSRGGEGRGRGRGREGSGFRAFGSHGKVNRYPPVSREMSSKHGIRTWAECA